MKPSSLPILSSLGAEKDARIQPIEIHNILAVHFFLLMDFLSENLFLSPIQVKPSLAGLILPQLWQNIINIIDLDQNLPIGLAYKPLLDGVSHPVHESVPVSINVQEHGADFVDAQLVPGGHLHDFLHRPKPTR
jgi:hypothetical protein